MPMNAASFFAGVALYDAGMNHEYWLLHLVTLDAGSWAEWFSGTMSAAAVIVALSAYPFANRQKRREQRELEKELGRSVGWKLITVLSHTGDVDRHLKQSLGAPAPLSPPSLKFPRVRPLGVPERSLRELNQNETEFLLKSQSADLLMEIDMCVGRYASICYSMREYKARHEAFFELMPPPVAHDGMTFTHALTPEQHQRVMPYATMLDALLNDMIALVDENMDRANAAIEQYQSDMVRHFGKPLMSIEPIVEPAPSNADTRS